MLWVKISDEKPPLNTEVFVYAPDDDPDMVVGMLCDDAIDEYWRYADRALAEITGEMAAEPTHWSVKPAPPTE